jgi:hypothetical protein
LFLFFLDERGGGSRTHVSKICTTRGRYGSWARLYQGRPGETDVSCIEVVRMSIFSSSTCPYQVCTTLFHVQDGTDCADSLVETGTPRQAHSFFLSKDTFSLMTEMSGDDASITSTQSSDTSIVRSSDDDLIFTEDLCLASIALSFRAGRLKVQHMNWFLHCKSCFFT